MRTVDYYIEKGYLVRVYMRRSEAEGSPRPKVEPRSGRKRPRGGQRALGVSRESVMRFLRRRIVQRGTN